MKTLGSFVSNKVPEFKLRVLRELAKVHGALTAGAIQRLFGHTASGAVQQALGYVDEDKRAAFESSGPKGEGLISLGYVRMVRIETDDVREIVYEITELGRKQVRE